MLLPCRQDENPPYPRPPGAVDRESVGRLPSSESTVSTTIEAPACRGDLLQLAPCRRDRVGAEKPGVVTDVGDHPARRGARLLGRRRRARPDHRRQAEATRQRQREASPRRQSDRLSQSMRHRSLLRPASRIRKPSGRPARRRGGSRTTLMRPRRHGPATRDLLMGRPQGRAWASIQSISSGLLYARSQLLWPTPRYSVSFAAFPAARSLPRPWCGG